VVTLTTEVATIEGTVTTAQGTPVDRARVVVFPDDPALWFRGTPFVRLSGVVSSPPRPALPAPRPGVPDPRVLRSRLGPGEFRTLNLKPGRYFIVALEMPDGPQASAPWPEWLERQRPLATAVLLTAGQTTSVQLRLTKEQ